MKAVSAWYRASGIRRFHVFPMVFPDAVGQHTGGVVYLVHYLTYDILSPDRAYGILASALLHDLAEYKTGDLPSPTKAVLATGALENMEANYLGEFVPPGMMNTKTITGVSGVYDESDKAILSIADAMDGLIRSAIEIRSGNRCFEEAYLNYNRYVWDRLTTAKNSNLICPSVWSRSVQVADYARSLYEGGAL